MSFKQRLALQVFAATPASAISFPYGFEKYAKVASKCIGKKLKQDWR